VSLPGTDGQALAATVSPEETVVVGSVGLGAQRRAAVWTAPSPAGPYVSVPDSAALSAGDGPGGAVMDLVSGGTVGYVATGSAGGEPAVWYSKDSTTWTQEPSAAKLLDGTDDTTIRGLAVLPQGIFAVGSWRHGTQTAGGLWYSSDGIRWRAATSASDPFVGPGDVRLESITSDGTDLIAAGSVRSSSRWQPATWISPDGGATWSQADTALPQPRAQLGTSDGSTVRQVTSPEAGDRALGVGAAFVAVGGGDGNEDLWSSPDGSDWTAVPLPAAPGFRADLVASDGSTVVVADGDPGRAGLLVSRRDGRWLRIGGPELGVPPAATAEPAALLSRNGQLLLAVDVAGADGASKSVILESSDATNWSVLASGGPLADARITGLYDLAHGLVATGSTSAGVTEVWASSHGRRWRTVAILGRQPPTETTAVGALGDNPIAIGSAPLGGAGQSVAVAWSTGPGGRTTASPLDSTATSATDDAEGVCSNGSTVVVVGSRTRSALPGPTTATPGATTSTSSASTTKRGGSASASASTTSTTTVAPVGSRAGAIGQADNGTEAAAWSSDNGSSWTTGTVSPPPGVGADQEMAGCAAVGTGFIAWGESVTADQPDVPGLWRSANGIDWTQLDLPSLASPGPGLADVAASATTWIGVGGGYPAGLADPFVATTSASGPDLAGPPAPSYTGPDGTAALWLSTDDGSAWARLPTGSAPWAGQQVSTDLVGWVAASDPVVAGTVDGRVAVWVGSPAGGS
jgi:hypothetical protein